MKNNHRDFTKDAFIQSNKINILELKTCYNQTNYQRDEFYVMQKRGIKHRSPKMSLRKGCIKRSKRVRYKDEIIRQVKRKEIHTRGHSPKFYERPWNRRSEPTKLNGSRKILKMYQTRDSCQNEHAPSSYFDKNFW